jgi:nicotinamide-nucleotide amidase
MNNINYSLSLEMGNLLRRRDMTIAVAESCTGGSLATEITAVPGSSDYFDRGFITYTNESKHELLEVPMEFLEEYGAVSEQVAAAMALGVLAYSHAEIAVSITGVAGPKGGTIDKPVGLVWFGFAMKNGECETHERHFSGGRKHVRRLSVGFALEWVIQHITQNE